MAADAEPAASRTVTLAVAPLLVTFARMRFVRPAVVETTPGTTASPPAASTPSAAATAGNSAPKRRAGSPPVLDCVRERNVKAPEYALFTSTIPATPFASPKTVESIEERRSVRLAATVVFARRTPGSVRPSRPAGVNQNSIGSPSTSELFRSQPSEENEAPKRPSASTAEATKNEPGDSLAAARPPSATGPGTESRPSGFPSTGQGSMSSTGSETVTSGFVAATPRMRSPDCRAPGTSRRARSTRTVRTIWPFASNFSPPAGWSTSSHAGLRSTASSIV